MHLQRRLLASMAMSGRKLPLTGIRVVEMAGLAPGPMAGLILADFGADVVRVDRIDDFTQQTHLSRGKRAIAIDCKKSDGRQIVRKLCSNADVLIEPFRPGVMEKLGLGPDVLLQENSRLIYARLTGYGQDGPMSRLGGHDINYIATAGILSRFKRADEKPLAPVNILADFAGGAVMCVLGIMMALHERNASNKGQVIDCSMTEGVAYLSTFLFETLSNELIWPNANEPGKNYLDTGNPMYDTYETADGQFMAIGSLEPKFHMEMLAVLQIEEPGQFVYECFQEPEKARAQLTAIFKKKTKAQWMTLFENVDACVTPVLSIDEAAAQAHNRARDAFVKNEKGLSVPKVAPRLMATPSKPDYYHCDISIGAHSAAILRQLNYSEAQIDALLKDKVVQQDDNAKL